MGVVAAIDRRRHCIEIGKKKKISRKNNVSHSKKFVAILTWHNSGEVTARQRHRGNGCIDVEGADYGISEEMRLLDKAFFHSPQTLNNSHWLFKKIGLREFCLLYFLILKPTRYIWQNFRHKLHCQGKEHFKWWCRIFWPWNLQVLTFKLFSQSVF